ncbi:hypothetical protein FQN54_000366 [Arachnomyces sp. PD_36]|nr:hypothetical protein FQN54_000366 [Arachnomyces sp. PD_36]
MNSKPCRAILSLSLIPFLWQPTLAQAWTHPGILDTTEDLDRVKSLVGSGQEPWKTAFERFSEDSFSSSSYEMQGPFDYVCRDTDTSLLNGFTEFAEDSVAALQTSLMWIITEDESFAKKSLEILNAWGETVKEVNGTDAQLAAALDGSNLVNAAELIRATYNSSQYPSGWASADISTFTNMVTQVLVPPASQTEPSEVQPYPFYANWGSSGEKFMLAAGVFTENTSLYEEAKDLILNSACSNLSGSISPTGQNSESGRDQAHTQLGLGNFVEAFTTLRNQNDEQDWFSMLSNRLATGLEYTAKFLQNETVPYDPSFYRCGADLVGGPWDEISSDDIYPPRPVYELGYAIYQDMGIELPFTKSLIELNTPDGQSPSSSVADGSAFQTLRFRRGDSNLSSNITT